MSDEATLRVALDIPGVETLAQYTMAEADVAGPFTPAIPDDLVEQSKLPSLDYTTPLEALSKSSVLGNRTIPSAVSVERRITPLSAPAARPCATWASSCARSRLPCVAPG